MISEYPLQWPDGWPRTRIDAREDRRQWKKTTLQYRADLEKEIKLLKAVAWTLNSNVYTAEMGSRFFEPRDPGVAVYFVLPAKSDASWQEVLGIPNPDPTVAEIDAAYFKLLKNHPDRGGDVELMKRANEARSAAKAWVTGDYHRNRQRVIPCDRFKEVRWNIAALASGLRHLRGLENVGIPGMLERAFEGMAQLTAGAGA